MEEQPIEPTALSETVTTCPECSTTIAPGKIFCNNCGFPVNGSDEQKKDWDINRYVLQAKLDIAKKRIRSAGIWLYVLAGIAILVGLVIGFLMPPSVAHNLSGTSPAVFGIIYVTMGLMYLGLGLLSRKRPFAALLIALIVYITIILMSAIASPVSIFSGIIFKVLIIIALVRGVMSGYEAEKLKKELNIG